MANLEEILSDQNTQSRRQFTKTLVGAGALAAGSGLVHAQQAQSTLPPPDQSGIEHIVVCMMENRSFDHFLGWVPGANGMQAGLTYQDPSGNSYSTYHLTTYQGCGNPDPDHSYQGGRTEYNNGLCNGWLLDTNNNTFAIGYYTASDLPFLSNAATQWTTFSNYFAAFMGPTFPNRLYQHCGVTDRISDSINICTLPTIWDRLAAAGISAQYYFGLVPFLFLFGTKYLSIMRPWELFQVDCLLGTLPQVSYVDPRLFIGETDGTANDDHPFTDIRNGEYFMNEVYKAVTNSPAWPNTLLIFNFDEWGGFFEHVPPQNAPDVSPEYTLRGFRVPCVIVSPWSQRGYVGTNTYDHTSVLKMIEWRWNLQPLSVRDSAAANIAEVLDFNNPNLNAPPYSVPGPYSDPCPSVAGPELERDEPAMLSLYKYAREQGWPTR
jgi:phospholipase C